MDMLPLVLSSGDPSGIGLEIACKAWQQRSSQGLPPFFLIADPQLVHARAALLKLVIPFHIVEETDPVAGFAESLPVLPLVNQQQDLPGQPSKVNAAGTIEAIERAVQLVSQKRAAALVTCPIAKKPLYDAGFAYPGHTEFLAHLSRQITGKTTRPVMMLAGPELRTVPVTIHTALRHVPEILTIDHIVHIARITAHSLETAFGILHPRLAIAGLNPHAGENGSMGTEEITIIRPAIDILQREGVDVKGPYPADTLFHNQARKSYDVALCMYHDQALIPVKTISFDKTVNVTLGLPFIRTSPDHGTAFDIATQGIANPESLIVAIQLAANLAKTREKATHGD